MTTPIVASFVPPVDEQSEGFEYAEYVALREIDRHEAVAKSAKTRAALKEELTAYAYENAAFLVFEDAVAPMPLLVNGTIDNKALLFWVDSKMRAADFAVDRDAVAEGMRQMNDAAAFDPPKIEHETLEELEKADIPDLTYRIAGVHQYGGNILFAAQAKAGKTTAAIHLCRSIADGVPFLGCEVIPVTDGKRVVYWDAELEVTYSRQQFMALGIRNKRAVTVVPMKGHVIPLTTDQGKEWTIQHLIDLDAEVWIIDTLSRIYRGDEDNNSQMQEFTNALDEIKRRSGVKEIYVIHHAGHAKEGAQTRARGASTLLGFADTLITLQLVSDDEDDTQRLMRITGRGELLPSVGYEWDKDANVLERTEVVKVSKAKRQNADQWSADTDHVWKFLMDNPDSTKKTIASGTDLTEGRVRKILDQWEPSGQVSVWEGDGRKQDNGFQTVRNAKYYSVGRIADPSSSSESEAV